MHYLILISLITRDSSILSSFIELQTNRHNKRFQRRQRRARDDYEDDDDEERRNSCYSFE